MSMLRIVAATLVLLCALATCNAAFADQVSNEWYHSGIGNAEHVVFGTSASRTAFLSSRQVVAAIQTRSGEISWRQVAPENDDIAKMLMHNQHVLTVSTRGTIRAFTAGGNMAWEDISSTAELSSLGNLTDRWRFMSVPLRTALTPSTSVTIDAMIAEDTLFVFSSNQISARSAASGDLKWSTEMPKSFGMKFASDAQKVFAISYAAARVKSVTIHRVDISNGKIAASTELKFGSLVDASSIQVVSGVLMAVDSSSGGLWYSSLAGTSAQPMPLSKLAPAAKSTNFKLIAVDTTFCIVQADSLSLLISVYQQQPRLIATSESNNAVWSSVVVDEQHRAHIALIQSSGSKVFIVNDASIQSIDVPFALSNTHGPLHACTLDLVRQSSVTSYRALFRYADFELMLVRASDSTSSIAWQRDEALAAASSIEFYRLPTVSSLVRNAVFPGVLQRFGLQARMLTSGFVDMFKSLKQRLTPKRSKSSASVDSDDATFESNDVSLVADHFGLAHLMLVLSPAANSVMALHSDTGDLVWQLYLGETHLSGANMQLLMLRSPASVPPMSESAPELEPLAAVVSTNKQTGKSSVTKFNPLSGAIVETSALSFAIDAIMSLPSDAAKHSKTSFAKGKPTGSKHGSHEYLLVDMKQRRAFTFPAVGSEVSLTAPMFFHRVDAAHDRVDGYSLFVNGSTIIINDAWRVAFESSREHIVALADDVDHQHNPHSSTRAAGTAVVHKYLNANLLAVITQATGRSDDTFLNVHVIDTIRGAVVSRLSIPGGHGPAHAALCENVVVVHYVGSSSAHGAQFEVAVLELTDAAPLSFGYGIAMQGGPQAETVSAWTRSKPNSIHQTYTFRSSVRAMEFTSSLHGLTNKQLLLALSSGQVISLDRSWIDPTRVPEPSAEDREEGVMPYKTDLPFNTLDILTRSNSVARLHSIVTHGAGLESTVLVASVGLDLSLSRTTPSAGFDVLNSDFNYGLLLTTVFGLLGGIFWTTGALKEQKLKQAWK